VLNDARAQVDEVYRTESRRVLATLIRLLLDFDLAEEALHEAFAAALERWPREGMPASVVAHATMRPCLNSPKRSMRPLKSLWSRPIMTLTTTAYG
jgi:hypothetical protein